MLPRPGLPPLRVRGTLLCRHAAVSDGTPLEIRLWRCAGGFAAAATAPAGGLVQAHAARAATLGDLATWVEDLAAAAPGPRPADAPAGGADAVADALLDACRLHQAAREFRCLAGDALADWAEFEKLSPGGSR